MKIVKIVLLVIVVAVVGVLGLAATKPDAYHVERSAIIAASPAAVYAQVNDFRKWEAWSPWEKLDPAMKRTYSGPESGKDASYGWVGNDKVGEGRMTIVESQPDAHVGIRLEFIKPWEETCDAAFTLTPEGEATNVKWTMDGKNTYTSKIFNVFMDMNKMIGADFEKGLAQLKTVAESTPASAATDAAGAGSAANTGSASGK
jgi:hypothetical protein